MSSELELTESGRLRLAFLISQEKHRPIREQYRPAVDLSPWAVPVLANEERRLKRRWVSSRGRRRSSRTAQPAQERG